MAPPLSAYFQPNPKRSEDSENDNITGRDNSPPPPMPASLRMAGRCGLGCMPTPPPSSCEEGFVVVRAEQIVRDNGALEILLSGSPTQQKQQRSSRMSVSDKEEEEYDQGCFSQSRDDVMGIKNVGVIELQIQEHVIAEPAGQARQLCLPESVQRSRRESVASDSSYSSDSTIETAPKEKKVRPRGWGTGSRQGIGKEDEKKHRKHKGNQVPQKSDTPVISQEIPHDDRSIGQTSTEEVINELETHRAVLVQQGSTHVALANNGQVIPCSACEPHPQGYSVPIFHGGHEYNAFQQPHGFYHHHSHAPFPYAPILHAQHVQHPAQSQAQDPAKAKTESPEEFEERVNAIIQEFGTRRSNQADHDRAVADEAVADYIQSRRTAEDRDEELKATKKAEAENLQAKFIKYSEDRLAEERQEWYTAMRAANGVVELNPEAGRKIIYGGHRRRQRV